MCINHHSNGEEGLCHVRTLDRRRFIHLHQNNAKGNTLLSFHFTKGVWKNVTDDTISVALKFFLRNWTIQSSGEFQSTVWTRISYKQVEQMQSPLLGSKIERCRRWDVSVATRSNNISRTNYLIFQRYEQEHGEDVQFCKCGGICMGWYHHGSHKFALLNTTNMA